jgi:hypothetical protein
VTWGSIAWYRSIDLPPGGARCAGRALQADLNFQKVYVIQDIIAYR